MEVAFFLLLAVFLLLILFLSFFFLITRNGLTNKDRCHCPFDDVSYNVVPITSPIVSGFGLQCFVKALRSPIGSLILSILKDKNQIRGVRRLASTLGDVNPMYYPISLKKKVPLTPDEESFSWSNFYKDLKNKNTEGINSVLGFKRNAIIDYTNAYESGKITPTQVAKAYIEAVKSSNRLTPKPLGAVIAMHEDDILEQAKASTVRYSTKTMLGPIDGVMMLVKDEVNVAGYKTFKGTSFYGEIAGIEVDCRIVELLRNAGAIIGGKTNMHEIGLGTTGHNTHWGTPRNPYDPSRYTGGSSSGSAAAVACGLVPLAVGLDGGGSIRIPSALCGIVGLKATFKRISMDLTICPSVSHIGPMAATVQDAAIAYGIMAGPNPDDALSMQQPGPHLHGFKNTDVSTLRVGIFLEHFNDGDAEIVQQCTDVVNKLEAMGATITRAPIIPYLSEMNMAHSITILTEMAQFMDVRYHNISAFSLETQSSLELARSLTSMDFIAAQRVRAYAMNVMETLFEDIDILISPATALVAPIIPPAAERAGESNLKQTGALMHHIRLGNLTGIPGISVPCGYNSQGMPISILLQSCHWQEAKLMQVAQIVERMNDLKEPIVYYDILKKAQEY